MDTPVRKLAHCAIYTRKSTEHNLDLEFNSLDAQREACAAYIKSQAHEGWRPIQDRYDASAKFGSKPIFGSAVDEAVSVPNESVVKASANR